MEKILHNIQIKEEELQKHLPLPHEVVQLLDGWFKAEMTYELMAAHQKSTLTRAEIAHIIEKGTTIPGKTLTEHLEAIHHAKSLEFIKTLAQTRREDLTEDDILQIHHILTNSIDPAAAGTYRKSTTKITGAGLSLAPAAKVPLLMASLVDQIRRKPTVHPIQFAADIASQLVSIHPFPSHNATVARLLLNLLLMQEGYPPALLEPGNIYKGVEKALEKYLEAAQHKEAFLQKRLHQPLKTAPDSAKNLLTIGALAKAVSEKVPTIRFWTQEGLLVVSQHTDSGYQLYDEAMVSVAQKIRKLQKEKRLTLKEIKALLEKNRALEKNVSLVE